MWLAQNYSSRDGNKVRLNRNLFLTLTTKYTHTVCIVTIIVIILSKYMTHLHNEGLSLHICVQRQTHPSRSTCSQNLIP